MTFLAAWFVWRDPTLEQLGWAAPSSAGSSATSVWRARSRPPTPPWSRPSITCAADRRPIAFIAFGEVPSVWVWIGGGVIAASSIHIARREGRAEGHRRREPGARRHVHRPGGRRSCRLGPDPRGLTVGVDGDSAYIRARGGEGIWMADFVRSRLFAIVAAAVLALSGPALRPGSC